MFCWCGWGISVSRINTIHTWATVLASSFSSYLLEENISHSKNARLWAKHCYTDLLMTQKAWLCCHFVPEQAKSKIYLRLDDHTMWLATAKSRLSCSTQVRCYSSVIKRLQFNCPHISGTTYINMWALLCKVSIDCIWRNGVHPPLESLSNL